LHYDWRDRTCPPYFSSNRAAFGKHVLEFEGVCEVLRDPEVIKDSGEPAAGEKVALSGATARETTLAQRVLASRQHSRIRLRRRAL